jgi:hypothetical protein
MPELVPGIQPAACSGGRDKIGPGNKCPDDVDAQPSWVAGFGWQTDLVK